MSSEKAPLAMTSSASSISAQGSLGLSSAALSALSLAAQSPRSASPQKLKELALADTALAAGWSPFLHLSPERFLNDPQSAQRSPPPAFNTLDVISRRPAGWGPWLAKRSAALSLLPKPSHWGGFNALCSSRQPDHLNLLAGLLSCGFPPSANQKLQGGALFGASVKAARLLIVAGANPATLGENGDSVWAAWALRCARQELSFSDLDWMESLGSPKTLGPLARPLSQEVFFKHPSREAVRQLSQRGLDAAALGIDSLPGLQELIWRALASDTTTDAFARVASLTGWPALFDAMDSPHIVPANEGDEEDEQVAPRLCSLMLLWGRVDCAAALRKHGWRADQSAESLALEALSEAGEDYASNTLGESLGWLARRFSPKGGPAALALWARASKWPIPCAAPLARALASKGWLPDSGPLCLSELRQTERFWRADGPANDDSHRQFAELLAYCEARSLKTLQRPIVSAAKKSPRL